MSILEADFNYENLNFKRLFSPSECVDKYKSWNEEFSWHQTGGRIFKFSDTEVLFSTGEYRNRELAQDKESVLVKQKVNLINGSYEVVAMGLRNPQGLFYDNYNNLILITEHGAIGGDEFNLIDLSKEIINFDGQSHPMLSIMEVMMKRNIKDTSLKSHKEHGFVEPIKYFKADSNGKTIGPSQIVGIEKIKNNMLHHQCIKDLFVFNLNEENKLENLERVEIGERIRDMIYNDGKLYLFLENSSSISIIDFKNTINKVTNILKNY